jgi:hypothetical protein
LCLYSEQQLFVDDAFKLFVQGDLSVIDPELKQDDLFTIFSEMKEGDAIDISLLFTAIIGNCKKDVSWLYVFVCLLICFVL